MFKMTGHEFKALMADDVFWPEGSYYEDAAITVNGVQDDDVDVDALDRDDLITVTGGFFYASPRSTRETPKNFEEKIGAWYRSRVTTTLVLDVDDNVLDDVMKKLAAMPGVRLIT